MTDGGFTPELSQAAVPKPAVQSQNRPAEKMLGSPPVAKPPALTYEYAMQLEKETRSKMVPIDTLSQGLLESARDLLAKPEAQIWPEGSWVWHKYPEPRQDSSETYFGAREGNTSFMVSNGPDVFR